MQILGYRWPNTARLRQSDRTGSFASVAPKVAFPDFIMPVLRFSEQISERKLSARRKPLALRLTRLKKLLNHDH
jgi:hypothetical protein